MLWFRKKRKDTLEVDGRTIKRKDIAMIDYSEDEDITDIYLKDGEIISVDGDYTMKKELNK